MGMSVLEQIVAQKRQEIERLARRFPHRVLEKLAESMPKPASLREALLRSEAPRIIAEVKRASPSRGLMRPEQKPTEWSAQDLAQRYFEGGAAALSVLTDVQFFWGNPDSLEACRQATGLPALRKDFILEPYQVDESRWLGADAILLIVRAMEPSSLTACARRAAELGMDVLVEVHDDAELDAALAVEHAVIGVNHRDLDKQTMDMDRALRMRDKVPTSRVMVAESGISDPKVMRRLIDGGITCFLVGEYLASHDHPREALEELRRA